MEYPKFCEFAVKIAVGVPQGGGFVVKIPVGVYLKFVASWPRSRLGYLTFLAA